jgi:dienelactone hydrolase
LRSKATLVEGGASQVSAVDDATAQMLEPVRQMATPVLDHLAADLMPRELVSAAVPFRTLSAVERLLAKRATLYEQDVRTDIVNVEVATPFERGLFLAMPQVKTIVSGEMFVLDHLDPTTRTAYPDGAAQERKASFVLTIPSGIDKGEPIPVVQFGHGLMTSRELVYLIANKLADAGYAAFAVDMPYHGHRAVCVETSDCKGDGTCNEVGQCIEPDGSKGAIATIEVPFVDAEYPVSTGFAFVEVGNLVGTRDHFAQAALDQMQALRVIRNADWVGKTGGWRLDGDDVVYLGMSLGGIIGSILTAAEPTLETFVLNVPGADYFKLIQHSDTFKSQFQHALDERGVADGSDAYFEFGNTIRWLLDPVDPLNMAQHAILDPVTYVDPVDGQQKTAPTKRVLIQMAKNDAVVPNVATEVLSERMGVPISEYEPAISNHGFLFDPTSFEGRDARNEMIEFFNER